MLAFDRGNMEKQELDIRSMVHAVRRRWWIVVVGAIVGLVLGVLVSRVIEEEFEAQTQVIVDHPDGSRADDEIATQAEAAHDAQVAVPAAEALGLPLGDVEKLLEDYRVDDLTNELLAFVATAPTGEEAAAYADALADQYVDARRAVDTEARARDTARLTDRVDDLETRIDDLEQQLLGVPLTPAGEPEPRLVGLLQSELTRLNSQHDAALADLVVLESERGDQTRVLSRALVPTSPTTPGTAPYLAMGLLAGLVLAISGVVFGEMIGQKARRRDDIASAAGAPVLVSTTLPGRGSHRQRLARALRTPIGTTGQLPRLGATVADTLLDGTNRSTLVVAGADADAEAALVSVSTAAALVTRGSDVTIKELLPVRGDRVARLIELASEYDEHTAGASSMLHYEPYTNFDVDVDQVARRSAGRRNDMKEQAIGRDEADDSVVIGFAGMLRDAEDETPILQLDDADNLGSLLVVVSGRTTPAAVRLVSERLSRAGAPVLAVAVVSPDRFDDTSGWVGVEPSQPVHHLADK